MSTTAEHRRILHEIQSDALGLAQGQTKFPKAAMILWDPSNPECYSIVGNASDAIHEAIVNAAYAESTVRECLRRLTFAARTSGGTAGPDAYLMTACDEAERVLLAAPGEQRPASEGRE